MTCIHRISANAYDVLTTCFVADEGDVRQLREAAEVLEVVAGGHARELPAAAAGRLRSNL